MSEINDIQLCDNLWLHELLVSRDHPDLVQGLWEAMTPELLDHAYILAHGIFRPVRIRFGIEMYPQSGFRTPALNTAVGGSKTSSHMKLLALDFTVHKVGVLGKIFKWMRDTIELPIWQLLYYPEMNIIHASLPDAAKKPLVEVRRD